MNDKDKDSKSEDELSSEDVFSDSMELFDDIFSKEKPDSPDSERDHHAPVKSANRKSQKKVTKETRRKAEQETKPQLSKAAVSPAPGKNGHPVKRDVPAKKKPPVSTTKKKVPPRTTQKSGLKIGVAEKSPNKDKKKLPPSASTTGSPPVKEDSPIEKPSDRDKELIGKKTVIMETRGKSGKGMNPLLFTGMILVLVILSMFTGKVMDYEAIIGLFKTTDSLSPESMPLTTDDTGTTGADLPGDLVSSSPEEESVVLKSVHSNSQVANTIEENRDVPPTTIEIPIEETTQTEDVPAVKEITEEKVPDVILEELPSYPYSVYLGSYSNITAVKKASSDYAEIGFPRYWIKLDLGEKGIWYRLFAGYFQTRKETDDFINTEQIQEAESKLTKYANLIGIYRSEQEMGKMKATLEELGYSPYMINDGGNTFRLYIGAFYEKGRAEEYNSDLAQNGIQSRLVER